MDAFDLFAFLAFLVVAAVWRLEAGPVAGRHRRWWAPPLAALFVAVVGALMWEVLGWRPLEAVGRGLSAIGVDGLWRWLMAFEAIAAWRDAIAGSGFGAWLVRAGQVVNQSLNLSFLITYVGARAVVDALVTWRVAEDASKPPPKWFFAVADDGTVGLRGHWRFTRTLFRTLGVVAFLLALLQVAGVTARLPLGFGTGWPSLALLVLGELAWFFAPRPLEALPRGERTAQPEVVPAAVATGFDDLLRELRNRWAPWLLADAPVTVRGVETNTDHVGPCAMLGSDEDRHVEGCCLMFEALLAGRSVLVEDVLPHRVAPCVGFFLSDRARRGERLLLLVDREDQLEAATSWLAQVLGGDEFVITGWRAAFTANPTAVVATLQQNLLRLLEHDVGGRRFGDDLGVVVALDAQATVLWHGPEIDALTHAIADLRGKPPQVLAIGEWRDGADEAYRNIVGLDVRELQLADSVEGAHYLAWRLESPGERAGASFFQEVVVGDIGAYLSPEVALAYPAVTHAALDVVLVQQEGLPFTSFVEDAENTRRVGQLDDAYASSSLDRKLTVVANDWDLRPSVLGATAIIGRDRVFDVVAAVRKWLPVTTETLVQVVSPPYLLRDYFCATFERRLRERRGFGALAPSYAPSRWSRAYTLYRRLERGWLDVAVALEVIEDAGSGERAHEQTSSSEDAGGAVALQARLAQLLQEQLDLPVPPRFEFERMHRFVPSALDFGRFEERLRVRLLPASREDRPRWHRVVEVVAKANGEPRALASYFAGHLHQNLLIGQLHAFGGRLYRIESVSKDGARVQALAIQTPEYMSHYRQHRTVVVTGDLEDAAVRDHRQNTAGTDALRLEITRLEVPLSVQTHGYYQFEAREGLDLAQADFVEVDVPERIYRHGKLLRARLVPSAGGERRDDLATTLALLLSEMLPSYFPEAHQYLRVLPGPAVGGPGSLLRNAPDQSAVMPAQDGGARAAIHLHRLVPQLEGVGVQDDVAGVTIYVVEDSPFDLGALATLVKKLDNILEDLKGYLSWYLRGGGETSRFLTFGLGEVPSELKLEELASFLAPFRAVGPVRRDRRSVAEPETGTLVDDGEKSCDFCGRVFDTPLTELKDGRHRCEACEADGVNTLNALRRLYREARRYFERRYGRRLRERIRIEFATAQQIAEYRGMSFSPHSGFDVRSVGLASRPGGTNTIHIENGGPTANARRTIIHELTHIWQFENFPPALMADTEFIEGQAVWVHLEYMEHLRNPRFESDREHFLAREDEYGRGYRRILAAMAAMEASTALDVTGWPEGDRASGQTGEETA